EKVNYLKLVAGQGRTIKFAVSFWIQLERRAFRHFRLWIKRIAEQHWLGAGASPHAATLRDGGAMNSGPTGLVMVSRRIRSISALAEGSSDHPVTSSTGRN